MTEPRRNARASASLMVTAALLALVVTAPLELKLVPTPSTVRPGERVRLEGTVRNASKSPIVICLPMADGVPSARADVVIRHLDGRQLKWNGTSNVHYRQVMWSDEVKPSRFARLAPGESRRIFWAEFSQRWDLPDGASKGDYTDRNLRSLLPGSYTLELEYRFDGKQITIMGEPHTYQFEGDSAQLWNAAWKGTLTAKSRFLVAP